MNRGALVAAVYNRVGVSSNDGVLTPTVLGQFVNDANHLIEVMENWPWLLISATFTTTSGAGAYAMPSDWLMTDELLVAQGDGSTPAIDRFAFRELDDRYPANITGMPMAWSIRGDQFMLRPIPDGSYVLTHWYFRQEPDLNGDTDTPVMPASFHTAIVELAASLTLRRVAQEGRAAVAEATFQNLWLPRLQAHRRRFSGPPRVRVRAGYMGP